MKKLNKNLRNSKEGIKKMLTKTTSNVNRKMSHFQHQVSSYIRKNPMKTVGFSMLAGALISQIRRPRR